MSTLTSLNSAVSSPGGNSHSVSPMMVLTCNKNPALRPVTVDGHSPDELILDCGYGGTRVWIV